MKPTQRDPLQDHAEPIAPESLGFGGRQFHEIPGNQLHMVCLSHMSAFMMDPTLERARLVEALLAALQLHPECYRPTCSCNPYARAQALWSSMVTHLRARDAGVAAPVVRH